MALTTKLGQKVYAPGLEARRNIQNGRIKNGVQSGELSKGEMAILRAQRNSMHNHLTVAKADDGVVGPKERRNLHRRANNASGLIYRFKHNGVTA